MKIIFYNIVLKNKLILFWSDNKIIYFSGTGNSKYVAEKIASFCNDNLIDSFESIKKRKSDKFCSDKPYVFVCPTYAWRIPVIFNQFIKESKFNGNKKCYFVMTCGGEIGNAQKYTKKLCDEKHFDYFGTYEIVMPENYTAMFYVPCQEEVDKIIKSAEPKIFEAADFIKKEIPIKDKQIKFSDIIKSDIINPVFYKLLVKDKKFKVRESCIQCGNCKKVCPLNNIELINGKPVWNKRCTHCMACINSCPAKAIEYGNASRKKPRYYNLKSR